MMRAMLKIVAMLAGVAVTLAAAGAIFVMTNSIEQMANPLTRALAIAAALAAGTGLLVSSVLIAVKLAVAVGVRPGENPPTAKVDVAYLQQQMHERRAKLEGRQHGHQ